MPNRIVKESIRTSDTLASVSAEAERLFWRLVVSADDFGRFDGRSSVILGQCLTSFLGEVTTEQVDAWMSELEAVDLLCIYHHDGRPYVSLTSWSKHQRTRAKDSKFPAPDNTCGHPLSSDSKRSQAPSIVVSNEYENENVFENECVNESGNENDDENGESDSSSLYLQPAEPEVAQIGRVFQEERFGQITPMLSEKLIADLQEFGFDWLMAAFREAVRQDVRNLPYVERILRNWKKNGRPTFSEGGKILANSRPSRAGPSSSIGRKRSITGGAVGAV